MHLNNLSAEDNSATFTFVDEEDVRHSVLLPIFERRRTYLDCGAGYGSYTLPALQKGCKVTVITPKVPPPQNEHLKLKMNIDLKQFSRQV